MLREQHYPSLRRLSNAEPDLFLAVSYFANNALSSIDDASSEACDAASHAVWCAVLLALESYRLAHFRLWADTEMGKVLIRYFPARADGASGSEGRRNDGTPDDNKDDTEDGSGAAEGATP